MRGRVLLESVMALLQHAAVVDPVALPSFDVLDGDRPWVGYVGVADHLDVRVMCAPVNHQLASDWVGMLNGGVQVASGCLQPGAGSIEVVGRIDEVGHVPLRFVEAAARRGIGAGDTGEQVVAVRLAALGIYLAVALDLCDKLQNIGGRYHDPVHDGRGFIRRLSSGPFSRPLEL